MKSLTRDVLQKQLSDYLESNVLHPLSMAKVAFESFPIKGQQEELHIHLQMTWTERSWWFEGLIEVNSSAAIISLAIADIKERTTNHLQRHPLIVVPYLSKATIERLEIAGCSGFDLCGNYLLLIPGELYVRQDGKPNKFPNDSPVNNPFRGRSGLIARYLTEKKYWSSLSELHQACNTEQPITMSQCSKAVTALVSLGVVAKRGREIVVIDHIGIWNRLREAWSFVPRSAPVAIRWDGDILLAFATKPLRQQWVVSGQSSVSQYALFGNGGSPIILVENVDHAIQTLGAKRETIPSFAQALLVQTSESGPYSRVKIDKNGIRWASALQTWIELSNGDMRQLDAAADVYRNHLLHFLDLESSEHSSSIS